MSTEPLAPRERHGSAKGRFSRGAHEPALFVGAVAAALFALRLALPSDLLDNDQERPAAYALDALANGRWIIQRDWTGEITSKPPLSTWLTSALALPHGRVNLFFLYLPSFLATAATAFVVGRAGARAFGPRSALFAVASYLLSPVAYKQVALARTDPLFAFTVFGTALVAERSSREGTTWLGFWLAAAAATLTKGPLGPILAAGGLLAALFERRGSAGGRTCALRAGHLLGPALFLLVTAGWFLLALRAEGTAVYDKLFTKELFAHAAKGGGCPGVHVFKPPLYLLSRFAPWSFFAAVGLWRVFAHPAPDKNARRLERFLASYLLAGLAVFSIPTHQRADHLFPLVPAAALLAGRELARIAPDRAGARELAALAAVFLFGSFLYG